MVIKRIISIGSAYVVCQALCWALLCTSHVVFLFILGVGSITSTLQMRNLRFREKNQQAQGHTAHIWQSQLWNQFWLNKVRTLPFVLCGLFTLHVNAATSAPVFAFCNISSYRMWPCPLFKRKSNTIENRWKVESKANGQPLNGPPPPLPRTAQCLWKSHHRAGQPKTAGGTISTVWEHQQTLLGSVASGSQQRNPEFPRQNTWVWLVLLFRSCVALITSPFFLGKQWLN